MWVLARYSMRRITPLDLNSVISVNTRPDPPSNKEENDQNRKTPPQETEENQTEALQPHF